MSANDDIEFGELGVSDEERAKRRGVLDKTTGKELKSKWEQGDRAELEARKQALAPEIITEPRCHVCTHPRRVWIEQMVVEGYGHKAIADRLPPEGDYPKPDRRSIKSHYENHMPIERMAIRKTLEEEAELLSRNYEEGAQGAISDRGMLKVLARKAYNDAQTGVTTVEPKDLIQIIKLLHDIENSASESKAEENEMALRIYTRAIQNVCNNEQLSAIAAEIGRLRAMDDIQFEMEMEQPLYHEVAPAEPKMIEAEVVDESTLPSAE